MLVISSPEGVISPKLKTIYSHFFTDEALITPALHSVTVISTL